MCAIYPLWFACGSYCFADPLVFVTNSTLNKVVVVDAGAGKVVGEIPAGAEPFGLAFSPDGARAYIANAKSYSVSVIDVSARRLLRNIPLGTRLPGVLGHRFP